MNGVVYSQNKLDTHQRGKALLKANFPYLSDVNSQECDFISSITGNKLRVQSVNYSLVFSRHNCNTTHQRNPVSNIFMCKKPGNIFIANQFGNKFFVYLFLVNKLIVVINLSQQVVDKLESFIPSYPLHITRNIGYNSESHLVNADDLLDALNNDVSVWHLF